MATDAQKRARAKYNKKNKRLHICLYPTDKDIRDHITKKGPYATYIKKLIRQDMEGQEGLNDDVQA